MSEREDAALSEDIRQIQAITAVICDRLRDEKSIAEENKESIAYRMAEMMTAAKGLYTELLPSLTDEGSKESAFDVLARFRLHYMNIWDMIQEFDELFMKSIVSEEGAEYANPDLDGLFEEDPGCDDEDGCECGR